jgi:hypothetical protein
MEVKMPHHDVVCLLTAWPLDPTAIVQKLYVVQFPLKRVIANPETRQWADQSD